MNKEHHTIMIPFVLWISFACFLMGCYTAKQDIIPKTNYNNISTSTAVTTTTHSTTHGSSSADTQTSTNTFTNTSTLSSSSSADTIIPSITVTHPSETPYTTNAVLIPFSGTASDDSNVERVEIQIDSAWFPVTGTNNWNYDWDCSGKPNDTYSFKFRAMDESGNYSEEVSSSILLDRDVPEITLDSPTDATHFSTESLSIQGTYTENHEVDAIKIRFDGGMWQNATWDAGSWNYSWDTSLLGIGNHTIEAQAIDTASNHSGIQSISVVFSINEEFEGSSLPARWNFQHLDGTGSITVDSGWVTIDNGGDGKLGSETADTGSFIYTALPDPGIDFVATVKVNSVSTHVYENTYLVIWENPANAGSKRFGTNTSPEKRGYIATRPNTDEPGTWNSPSNSSGFSSTPYYFRVERIGTTYQFYLSGNNSTYSIFAGQDSITSSDFMYIGLVGSGWTNGAVSVSYDWILIEPVP